MPNSRLSNVSTVGQRGPQVTHVPDTEPMPTGGVDPNNFEAADFAAVAGGAGQTANTQHGGHGKGSGGPSFEAQKAARGHREVNALTIKGRAPKRSAGKPTGPSSITDNRPID